MNTPIQRPLEVVEQVSDLIFQSLSEQPKVLEGGCLHVFGISSLDREIPLPDGRGSVSIARVCS